MQFFVVKVSQMFCARRLTMYNVQFFGLSQKHRINLKDISLVSQVQTVLSGFHSILLACLFEQLY